MDTVISMIGSTSNGTIELKGGGESMELHNIIEDIVIAKVTDVFNTIEKSGNSEKLCTCEQCRLGTACYVLNRTAPFYIISSRGAARIQIDDMERQQKEVDITVLIYEGIKRVNHNHRPISNLGSSSETGSIPPDQPVFNIPAITGRLLDGNNFAPISGVRMELYYNGSLVAMKDNNWQNPLNLVSHTEGTYIFWPVPIIAKKSGEHALFEFTLKIKSEEENLEALTHVFKIPVISEIQTVKSFTLEKTYKLPDFFMFPPGGDEQNRSLSLDE